MALNMTKTTARLILLVGLSAVLASSCSTGGAPSAMAIAPDALITDRYRQGDVEDVSYTTAVPRVYVDSELVDSRAPESYTVVRGDTLWDISDRFLKEPWRWSEIWGYNPQVYNPHLIYPGDVLALEYVNGRPSLSLTRKGKTIPHASGEPPLGAATPAAGDNGTARIKLQPKIRAESLDDSIPTIAGDSIAHFLVHPRVVDLSTLNNAPYVIGNHDERLISSLDSKIYVRGRLSRGNTNYGVFRRNKALIDPVSGVNLGYEMVHVSDAKLMNVGDPSTLALTSNRMETIAGDVILPLSSNRAVHKYVPRMPQLRGEARIVSLVDAIAQTGRNQVVVLNIGSNSSIKEGDVLAVETRGKSVVDRAGRMGWEHVQLPNQRTGVLMVYKTFDTVSYALVMESTRPLKVNDIITGI